MLWSTLFNKIGKQPLSFTRHNHVYALIGNPETYKLEKVWLDIKYDAKGLPYLVRKTDK